MNTIETVLQRLVICEPSTLETGCWEWPGHPNTYGYGDVSVAGKRHKVHRLVFEHFMGPIPAGLQLDHLCRNRICANYTHLEPVTCQVNLLRGETHNSRNATKTHCMRGHEFTPENTLMARSRYGRICRQCRRERGRRNDAKRPSGWERERRRQKP